MKIAALIYESHEANHIAARLVETFPTHICGLVVSSSNVKGSGVAGMLRRLRADGGWGFVVPKTIEVFGHRLLARWFPGRFGLSPTISQLAKTHGIPLMAIEDVNSQGSLDSLRALDADLFISIHFNQILRSPVLSIPRFGTLNVHGSLLPRNRGLFPYFWALANGDEDTGVTVHLIDPGIDTGAIVGQKVVEIRKKDSVAALARRCAQAGGDLLVEVIRSVIDSGAAPSAVSQEAAGNYESWPTADAVRQLRTNGHRYGRPLRPIRPPDQT